jgi:3-oxoacid CoA-transferase
MCKRYTTKAFGQVMGKAAKITIVEAENIVPVGDIHPDNVQLPGIYVDRIVPSLVQKVIEIRKLKEVEGQAGEGKKIEALLRRERIARRTSKELKHGYYVNLGVGESIPWRIWESNS